MAKSGRTYVNQSVSFPPGLLESAKERADNLGLSFSSYVQKLLEKDVGERGALVFEEKVPEAVEKLAPSTRRRN